MILQKREKILALVTVVLLLVVVAYQVYSKFRGSHSEFKTQYAKAAAEVERMKTRLENAKLADERMEGWRQRSLPSDSRTAQSLYQNWLLRVAQEAKFTDTKIDASQRRRRGDVYFAPQFSFQAKTSLDGLTQFMHSFYRADHLHQILNLTVTPEDDGKTLKIQMTIEALSLPDAKLKDELSEKKSERELAAIDEYKKKIGGRNLFAAYKPSAPPEKSKGPEKPKKVSPEALKTAHLTGVTFSGGKLTAWIMEKTSGKHHALHEGDTFEIDTVKCKMLRIAPREAEIEIGAKCRLVLLGENLSGEKDSPKGDKPPENDKPKEGAEPSADKKPSEEGPSKGKKPYMHKTPSGVGKSPKKRGPQMMERPQMMAQPGP